MIKNLVYERQSRAQEVSQDIMGKWGGHQVIAGPIISVPYEVNKQTRYYHILPNTLSIDTAISPTDEELRRGIYSVIGYISTNTVKAQFPRLESTVTDFANRWDLEWNHAVVSFGIGDVKGVTNNLEMDLSWQKLSLEPGLITADVLSSGVSRTVALDPASSPSFSLEFGLNGGEQFHFVPLGETTRVTVAGTDWIAGPSFNGSLLPDTRDIEETTFSAEWISNKYHHNFPTSWAGSAYQLLAITEGLDYGADDIMMQEKLSYDRAITSSPTEYRGNLGDSAFGFKLIETVNNYSKSTRAINYAFLIIGLSFLVFFLIEVTQKKPVHILQYLLIGFALVVFYTLQLSLSEHIGFDPAYVISGLATILLITLYTRSIWSNTDMSWMTGGILGILYILVFVILQSEDYALLIGSIAVFLILALLMYFTRKIDWYSGKK